MKKILLFLLVFNLFSCQLIEDENFSFDLQPYYGKEINTEGYFKLINGEYSGTENINDTSILFFYKNGIVLFSSELDLVDEKRLNKSRGIYYNWGIYKIENDSVYIQNKFNSGDFRTYVYTRVAKIENDSTINFCYTKSTNIGYFKTNHTYVFVKFISKPDSINDFIK
jgi:hypothetical protein